jgi:CRP-like cAMP-binding protein
MKIEREAIQLAPLNLDQIKLNAQIIGTKRQQSLPLSSLQLEMISLMQNGFSIEGIVQSFLNRRVLVSFVALENLIEFLVSEELILNDGFKDYFSQNMKPAKSTGFMNKLKNLFKPDESPPTAIKDELRKLPFLRSMEPEILEVFLNHMRLIEAPKGIAVCQEGQKQRSLFVLFKGQASVIRRGSFPKPRRLATLSEGSVFGEIGFFLNEPRTADVITDSACQIIRLKYQAEVFDQLIQKEAARSLQRRFWVIHALLKSKTFQSIPDDCFDALVFSGQMKTIPADTLICREGDSGESCYVVVQGSVVISRNGQAVRVLGQGDSFGEVALMLNQGKRSATVRSQTETVVLEIPFDRFYQLLSRNLMLACEFEKIALQYIQADRERV